MSVYSYDNASRLTNITYRATVTNAIDYAYDSTTKRSSRQSSFSVYNLSAAVTNSSYNAANQQLTFGSYNILYDANGNVTNIISGTTTSILQWDARNRLTNMLGAVTANFLYDGQGRRISRSVNGTSEKYLYDGLDIIQQLNNSGTVSVNYFRGLTPDEPWLRDEVYAGISGNTFTNWVFITDALGSVVALTDSSKNIGNQYAQDPFGLTTSTGLSISNSYKFTAREDDGTGIYYYRARYYSPVLDRFISEDPLRELGGLNFYAYAMNDPVLYSDALGLMAWYDVMINNGADFFGGAASALTLSITDHINNIVSENVYGINSVVNKCSGWYMAGTVSGIALSTAIGAKGLPAGLKGIGNIKTKQAIGESLSLVENLLKGSTLLAEQRATIPGLATIVDSTWQSGSGIYYVEAKFGTSILRPLQEEALEALGSQYHVERWGYDFFARVGGYLGFGYGAAGGIKSHSCGCN